MDFKHDRDIAFSQSGVWQIFTRMDWHMRPGFQRYTSHELRWKCYEGQHPDHRNQIDVKFIPPLQGTGRRKHYQQSVIIDNCPRL